MKKVLAVCLFCAGVILVDGKTVRLESSRISLGRFYANTPPTAELVVLNDSDVPLDDIRVRTSCGCLSAIPDGDTIQAHGRMRIRLVLSPEKVSGVFSYSVFIEVENKLLRASVTGEAISLIAVRPSKNVNLGRMVCRAPFQSEFLLSSKESMSIDKIATVGCDVHIIQTSKSSFRVLLSGFAPREAGYFRYIATVYITSPVGWQPIELSVFGEAIKKVSND